MAPAEDQHTARPSVSVMVICVLLKVAAICTRPWGMARRSRFFLTSFLRFAAAAGFPAAPVSGVAAGDFGSFATFAPFFRYRCLAHAHTEIYRQERLCYLALLTDGLLLGCDRAAPRTLACARVGVCTLAAHRQIPAVPNPAIGLNFNQPADIHLNLLAEIAFHAAFLLDGLTNVVDFLFSEVADFLGVIHTGLCREALRALLADSIDGGQSNPQTLLNRKIDTCYASHTFSLILSPGAACAWDWCKSPGPHRADESLCICRKSFLPMPVLSCSLFSRSTCNDTRSGRASNRRAKAPRLLYLRPECG